MFSHTVTKDISLKLLQEHHATPLFECVDRNREHLREWLPWVDRTKEPMDSLNFIKMTKQKFAMNTGFECGIWVDDKIAGVVGLHYIEWLHRRSSLGYWLDKDVVGRGVMTQSVTCVLDYLFGELDMNYVSINAAPDNKKSCAIPERLGFKLEGCIRDQEWLYDHFVDSNHYGMKQDEWFARP